MMFRRSMFVGTIGLVWLLMVDDAIAQRTSVSTPVVTPVITAHSWGIKNFKPNHPDNSISSSD